MDKDRGFLPENARVNPDKVAEFIATPHSSSQDKIAEEQKFLSSVSKSHSLAELKQFLLRFLAEKHSYPLTQPVRDKNVCCTRGVIWKILLGISKLDAKRYMAYVEMGASALDDEIRDDTFRTFQRNDEYWSQVDEVEMIRILNAFAHAQSDTIDSIALSESSSLASAPLPSLSSSSFTTPNSSASLSSQSLSSSSLSSTSLSPPSSPVPISNCTVDQISRPVAYTQGMNVVLGPFLFIMPELDAFESFSCLICAHCPRYFQKNLDGVHHGCMLFDRCLQILDFELSDYLQERLHSTKIFSFPIIMTLFANMQPLDEVVRLWDTLFAFGVHLTVLILCSHIILHKEEIMVEQQSSKITRLIMDKQLNSMQLLSHTFHNLAAVPKDLFQELVIHTLSGPDMTKHSCLWS